MGRRIAAYLGSKSVSQKGRELRVRKNGHKKGAHKTPKERPEGVPSFVLSVLFLWLTRQAVTKGFRDGFGFGVDVELLVDVTQMKLNCVDYDPQPTYAAV